MQCPEGIEHLGQDDIHFSREDFVFVIASHDKLKTGLRSSRVRSFCSTLESAQNLINNNIGDVREPGVQYASIEKVMMNGVDMPSEPGIEWYEWKSTGPRYDDGHFIPSTTPDDLKTTINFF